MIKKIVKLTWCLVNPRMQRALMAVSKMNDMGHDMFFSRSDRGIKAYNEGIGTRGFGWVERDARVSVDPDTDRPTQVFEFVKLILRPQKSLLIKSRLKKYKKITVRAENISELILPTRKIEFESCK